MARRVINNRLLLPGDEKIIPAGRALWLSVAIVFGVVPVYFAIDSSFGPWSQVGLFLLGVFFLVVGIKKALRLQ